MALQSTLLSNSSKRGITSLVESRFCLSTEVPCQGSSQTFFQGVQTLIQWLCCRRCRRTRRSLTLEPRSSLSRPSTHKGTPTSCAVWAKSSLLVASLAQKRSCATSIRPRPDLFQLWTRWCPTRPSRLFYRKRSQNSSPSFWKISD